MTGELLYFLIPTLAFPLGLLFARIPNRFWRIATLAGLLGLPFVIGLAILISEGPWTQDNLAFAIGLGSIIFFIPVAIWLLLGLAGFGIGRMGARRRERRFR